MTRSQRLNPIKKIARKNEKSAAKALGKSLENQRNENEKLAQLKIYRQEYLVEMESKVKQGITGARLQQYHQFLSKIDFAITQQNEVITSCNEQLSMSQGHWQEKRGRTKAITQVMDTMKTKENQAMNKRETIQNDEISTQAFLRNKKQP